MGTSGKIRKTLLLSMVGACAFFLAVFGQANVANAGCSVSVHENYVRKPVNQHTSQKFTEHRDWLLNTFFKDQVLPALMLFTEQMSAVAMQQTMVIGQFLDAKHQLETQRLFQELQVEAHKDYQPSEDFCWFGTNVKSLAATEQKGHANTYILSRRQMARSLGEKSMGGASNGDNDKKNRWDQFLKYFCDPQDSDWVSTNPTSSGLAGLGSLCSAFLPEVTNADIDYKRLIDSVRTINLMEGPTSSGSYDLTTSMGTGFVTGTAISGTERAVTALGSNLYGHDLLTRSIRDSDLKQEQYQNWYMALRSVAAKRSVAENSFNAIVGMKSGGTAPIPPPGGFFGVNPPDTYKFLGAIMTELGVPATEVRNIIGSEPSYYSQLELLAKNIYQNPDFYANLYDKPANVKRKSVALKAIELMVDRAIYESQIRQEMVSSVLLSARLREPFKEAQKGLTPGQ